MSEDDLNLLEIPEPPTMLSKIDNRSSCESGSAITSVGQRQINKSRSDLQSQHSQSSLLSKNENGNVSNLQQEGQVSTNEDSVYRNEHKSIKQGPNVRHHFQTNHFRIF